MEWILEPWPWYVSGPLLGLFVPLLLLSGNKQFGISSSFEQICYNLLPNSKKLYKNYDARKNAWKLFFVLGIFLGAVIAAHFLSEKAINFLPEIYFSFPGMVWPLLGGILIGFGTRYANGCTSGHAIFGLSILNKGSLIAVISFFASGVLYTFLSKFF